MKTYAITDDSDQEPYSPGGGKVVVHAYGTWGGTLQTLMSTSGKDGVYTPVGGETEMTADGFARFSVPEGAYIKPAADSATDLTVTYSN